MNRDYVRSSPHFFRLIKRACAAIITAFALGALLAPAPLLPAADPAQPPNPAKSAWFLLWTQELVSHGAAMAWLVVIPALLFIALPWLSRKDSPSHAVWLGKGTRVSAAAIIACYTAIIALTIVAAYFRGAQWSLVSPF